MVCQEGGPVWAGRTQQSRLKLLVPKLSEAAFGARPRLRELRKELAPATLPAVGPGLWKLPKGPPLSISAVFPFPLRSAYVVAPASSSSGHQAAKPAGGGTQQSRTVAIAPTP